MEAQLTPSSLKEAVELHAANTGQQSIVVDGIEVELTHADVKNLRMRVTREGEVKVSVPRLIPFDLAKQFVVANIGWVKEQLGKQEERTVSHEPLTEAASYPLWGKELDLRLTLEDGRSRIKAELTDDAFVIFAPADVTEEKLRSTLDKLLVEELEARVADLAPGVEARIGKHAAGWRFRRMVSRWGSCNTKTANITLNTALAEFEPVYLEYVMCHELCHLWESGHDVQFYAHLAAACPSWKQLRTELNKREIRV